MPPPVRRFLWVITMPQHVQTTTSTTKPYLNLAQTPAKYSACMVLRVPTEATTADREPINPTTNRILAMKKIVLAVALSALTLPASQALAVDEHFIAGSTGANGYDVVAYHTEGKPVEGSASYSTMYQGVTWQFSSMENQAMFEGNPAMYAPAYGGWCSAGASKGKKVPTKPELFAIVDGQLYLNSSVKAHEGLFLANTDAVISKGESNWKQIFATPAGDL